MLDPKSGENIDDGKTIYDGKICMDCEYNDKLQYWVVAWHVIDHAEGQVFKSLELATKKFE
jgi:hypothetical protein